MEKTTSKKAKKITIEITNKIDVYLEDEKQRTKLIDLLKKIYSKNNSFIKELKINVSKEFENTFSFSRENAQLIWLFLRATDAYREVYSWNNNNKIDTSNLFGMMPNQFDPNELELSKESGSFNITIFQELNSLHDIINCYKWNINSGDLAISKTIGLPKVVYFHPTLSESLKKKLLEKKFKKDSKDDKFTAKGSINLLNKDDLLILILAAYLFKIPNNLERGSGKIYGHDFSILFEKITQRPLEKSARTDSIKRWKANFYDVASHSPFYFFNAAIPNLLK